MNKIKVEIIDERVKIEFDFDDAEVAKSSLQDEAFIEDIVGVIKHEEEPQYDDNDMLRAEVTTQGCWNKHKDFEKNYRGC